MEPTREYKDLELTKVEKKTTEKADGSETELHTAVFEAADITVTIKSPTGFEDLNVGLSSYAVILEDRQAKLD